jgi:Zn ribbon nucleic-acid-binding protein
MNKYEVRVKTEDSTAKIDEIDIDYYVTVEAANQHSAENKARKEVEKKMRGNREVVYIYDPEKI